MQCLKWRPELSYLKNGKQKKNVEIFGITISAAFFVKLRMYFLQCTKRVDRARKTEQNEREPVG